MKANHYTMTFGRQSYRGMACWTEKAVDVSGTGLMQSLGELFESENSELLQAYKNLPCILKCLHPSKVILRTDYINLKNL
jgi:hypothetical protein